MAKIFLTNDMYVARAAAAQNGALLSTINSIRAQQAKDAAAAQAAYDAGTYKAPRQVIVISGQQKSANPLDKDAYDQHRVVSQPARIYYPVW